MKRMSRLSFITLMALVGFTSAKAQEKIHKKQDIDIQFYRNRLNIDSAKAEEVSRIQSEYKLGMASVMRDSSLTEDQKRTGIQRLKETKNMQLRQILSASQQEKIIPSTERMHPRYEDRERLPVKP